VEEVKKEIKDLCDIRIDKEGIWYYRGAEMYRTDIVEYLYRHVKATPEGYFIEMSEYDRCRIDVEDTAFVVRVVEWRCGGVGDSEKILIRLSDGSEEELSVASLFISRENVLYCSIKDNAFKARFSRKSYYQIARYVQYDDLVNKFYLLVNGNRFFIEERHH
jgi:hypothetical protein